MALLTLKSEAGKAMVPFSKFDVDPEHIEAISNGGLRFGRVGTEKPDKTYDSSPHRDRQKEPRDGLIPTCHFKHLLVRRSLKEQTG